MPKKAVLLVDDDTSFCQVVHHYLVKKGWSVTEASNFAEALPLCNSCDVVILDYAIGEPDGEALLQQIRKDENMVPVVMVTGVKPPCTVVCRLQDLGILQLIEKPFELKQLHTALDNAIRLTDLLDRVDKTSEKLVGLLRSPDAIAVLQ